jgi:hypothetical protein
MVTAKIETVPIGDIDANPFRRLVAYPYVESKIETLMRSIAEVGMWEGAIGRKHDNRVQLAFAHHRLEAARRLGLKEIPMIIRDLDDEQMLMFMGRENGEDYNADFNCMLETWEAAITYLKRLGAKLDRLTVAGLLGWTRFDHKADNQERPNHVADVCDLAFNLINEGHYDRQSFTGMNVRAVQEIVTIQSSRLKRVEKTGKAFKWDDSKVKQAKDAVVVSGKAAVKEYRAGNIAAKDLRAKADEVFIKQKAVRKEPALLYMAVQPLITRIDGLLRDDADGRKLTELAETLPGIVKDLSGDDKRALDGLRLALDHVGQRVEIHQRKLDYKKVVALNPATKRITAVKGA